MIVCGVHSWSAGFTATAEVMEATKDRARAGSCKVLEISFL